MSTSFVMCRRGTLSAGGFAVGPVCRGYWSPDDVVGPTHLGANSGSVSLLVPPLRLAPRFLGQDQLNLSNIVAGPGPISICMGLI